MILVHGGGELLDGEEKNSILLSVKKLLGIPYDYEHFDVDIVMHINSVFLILAQLGVGPAVPFQITGAEEKWTDFIPEDKVPMVKSYTGLRVRLLFDPPLSGSVMNAIQDQIAEFEWRMNVFVETPPFKEEVIDDGI